LFVILLCDYVDWTGDLEFFAEMRPVVNRCLEWIDRHGDHDKDGWIDYDCPREVEQGHRNLINQGWKDSGNAILRADGGTPQPPIAMVEVQAYVYAAKRGLARVCSWTGDIELSRRMDRDADRLRTRF